MLARIFPDKKDRKPMVDRVSVTEQERESSHSKEVRGD